MCQWMAQDDGLPTSWHLSHYGALAAGGAGLIVVEATAVAPEGRIAIGDMGLWDDSQVEPLSKVTGLIRSLGATAAIQLGHAGRKGSGPGSWDSWTSAVTRARGADWQTVAPSSIANDGLPVPRELTTGEVAAIPEAFARAAGRAVAAGFEAIEIHAAHGYLLHQFLSPIANQRIDAYGGSYANRTRLVLEVVRAVKAVIGGEVALMIRLSATDWIDGGWDVPQTQALAPALHAAGVHHIDVSGGGINTPTIPTGPGYMVAFAQALRHASPATVNAVGLIHTPEQAEQILASGQADAVMLGRAVLANPHLPLVWAAKLGAELQGLVPGPYHRAHWAR